MFFKEKIFENFNVKLKEQDKIDRYTERESKVVEFQEYRPSLIGSRTESDAYTRQEMLPSCDNPI